MDSSKASCDAMHIIEPRAAGIDMHKMQLTVSVRLCEPVQPEGLSLTETVATDQRDLQAMTGWLGEHRVGWAAMEGTGILRKRPFHALETAGIRRRLVHAQRVKPINGRKTDIADSLWPARICQFGLARASYLAAPEFFRSAADVPLPAQGGLRPRPAPAPRA